MGVKIFFKTSIGIVAIITIVVLVLLSPFLFIFGLVLWESYSFPSRVQEEIIPQKIEILDVVANDYEPALPGGVCAGIAFKISDKTAENIKRLGVSYFDDVPLKWEQPWRKYSEPINEGARAPNGCLNNIENFFEEKGYRQSTATLAYYTYEGDDRSNVNLWIFPEWKIIRFTISDN